MVRRLDNSWARAWTSSSGYRRTVCTGARLLLGAWPVRGMGQTAWVLSEDFSASCNAVILLKNADPVLGAVAVIGL